MLSYRHAYHAGNHADVLKHAVLVELVAYLARKDKPFTVLDTHAGAGLYDLESAHAGKLAEHADGIGRLWGRDDLPEMLAGYEAAVREINPDGRLRFYPGSPWLARRGMRAGDRLELFELHPSDEVLLRHNLASGDVATRVHAGDGFAGIKALLPPVSRRGLTLIDPPYEVKTDYGRVVDAVREARRRFATGMVCVWYPGLARSEARQLPERLLRLADGCDWLHVRLDVRAPSPDGLGMHGSGLVLFNPPWTLPERLRDALPWLCDRLARAAGAEFKLDYRIA